MLLIGAASLLQIGASFITNLGSYYKLGQPLLQTRSAITNWDRIYYKLGQVLQIRTIITNWSITSHSALKLFIQAWKTKKIYGVLGQALKPNLRTNLITFDSNQLRKRGYLWVKNATVIISLNLTQGIKNMIKNGRFGMSLC